MKLVQLWWRRVRATLGRLHSTVTYFRDERANMQRVSTQLGLPVSQDSTLFAFAKAVAAIPRDILAFERHQIEIKARMSAEEPFRRIARQEIPEQFTWTGDATMVFPHNELPGLLTVHWDGARVYGKHTYRWWPTNMPAIIDIALPPPGRILGPDRYANVVVPETGFAIERVAMHFDETMPGERTSTFSAMCIVSGRSEVEGGFHRYIFRGVRLRGWGAATERVTLSAGHISTTIKRDSYETPLFGRRARLTQVSDDESNQQNQVIGVTIVGAALDENEEHILWLVLSFVAGCRAQAIAREHFDDRGALLTTVYLGSNEYGAGASHPPFDLRIAFTSFDPATFDVLATGFSRLVRDEFPLAVALHHLHDANTSYTQVEMKNLLFCVHTIFESWVDVHGKRNITTKARHTKLRRQLDLELERVFGADTEIRQSVRDAIKYAYQRTGAVLQEMFFESKGRILTDVDRRALRRRNGLFHNGYLKERNGQSKSAFLQEIIDDTGSLRTLAHEAILKLAGYQGTFFDYGTWCDRHCELAIVRDTNT